MLHSVNCQIRGAQKWSKVQGPESPVVPQKNNRKLPTIVITDKTNITKFTKSITSFSVEVLLLFHLLVLLQLAGEIIRHLLIWRIFAIPFPLLLGKRHHRWGIPTNDGWAWTSRKGSTHGNGSGGQQAEQKTKP